MDDYFFDTGTIAQLKVCKGCVVVVVFVFLFVFFFFFNFFSSIHSSPTRTPVSSRKEVHAHLHWSDAGKELRKTTQSDAGEDWVPSMVVDGLIGSGLF